MQGNQHEDNGQDEQHLRASSGCRETNMNTIPLFGIPPLRTERVRASFASFVRRLLGPRSRKRADAPRDGHELQLEPTLFVEKDGSPFELTLWAEFPFFRKMWASVSGGHCAWKWPQRTQLTALSSHEEHPLWFAKEAMAQRFACSLSVHKSK